MESRQRWATARKSGRSGNKVHTYKSSSESGLLFLYIGLFAINFFLPDRKNSGIIGRYYVFYTGVAEQSGLGRAGACFDSRCWRLFQLSHRFRANHNVSPGGEVISFPSAFALR